MSSTSKELLLLSSDLFFSSKITGTAEELGLSVVVEGNLDAILPQLPTGTYRGIFLDLALPGLVVADVIALLPSEKRPRVLAFGAHVQTARLAEARKAGCDDVLPRSRFSADLPEILKQFLV